MMSSIDRPWGNLDTIILVLVILSVLFVCIPSAYAAPPGQHVPEVGDGHVEYLPNKMWNRRYLHKIQKKYTPANRYKIAFNVLHRCELDNKSLHELVTLLGDRKWRVRQKATKELCQRAGAWLPILEKMVAHEDPEIAWRVKYVVKVLRESMYGTVETWAIRIMLQTYANSVMNGNKKMVEETKVALHNYVKHSGNVKRKRDILLYIINVAKLKDKK